MFSFDCNSQSERHSGVHKIGNVVNRRNKSTTILLVAEMCTQSLRMYMFYNNDASVPNSFRFGRIHYSKDWMLRSYFIVPLYRSRVPFFYSWFASIRRICIYSFLQYNTINVMLRSRERQEFSIQTISFLGI